MPADPIAAKLDRVADRLTKLLPVVGMSRPNRSSYSRIIGRSIRSTSLIVCEATGRPYLNAEFRRKWRIVC